MVSTGDTIKKGQKLMQVDLDYIKANAPSIVTPLILTNLENRTLEITDVSEVKSQQLIMTVKQD